jgi:dTDP-4-dehydrorhamnose reductase
MKYLITGKNGQLAKTFIRRFEERAVDFAAPDESLFDITNPQRVAEVVEAGKPDVIINCAAFNFVDRAETEKDTAFSINASGPKNLARAAAKQKAMLVHFGSDYVFDGHREVGLYVEDDAVHPLNEYGRSKLAGEQNVMEAWDRCLVLRLSWVFGPGKQNFIYKLIEWAKSKDHLQISHDEFSVPTCTDTVVDVTLQAVEREMTGLYHLTNTGFCSRYEWAKLIMNVIGMNTVIEPVSREIFNLPAKRPKFSAMSNGKLASLLNINIATWDEAVTQYLQLKKETYG